MIRSKKENIMIAIDIETIDDVLSKKKPSKFIKEAAFYDGSLRVFSPQNGNKYLNPDQVAFIKDVLSNSRVIIGHNIKELDLKVIFDKIIPNDIGSRAYDTLEKVKSVFPARLTYALKSTHSAGSDAIRAWKLYDAFEKKQIDLKEVESLLKPERQTFIEIKEAINSLNNAEKSLIVAPRYFWRDLRREVQDYSFQFLDISEGAPCPSTRILIVAPSDLVDNVIRTDIQVFSPTSVSILYPELSSILWPDKKYAYPSLGDNPLNVPFHSRKKKGQLSIIDEYINGGYYVLWQQMTPQVLLKTLRELCPNASINWNHNNCKDNQGNLSVNQGVLCHPRKEHSNRDEDIIDNLSVLVKASHQKAIPVYIAEDSDTLQWFKKNAANLEAHFSCHYVQAPANSPSRRIEITGQSRKDDSFVFTSTTLQDLLKDINSPIYADIVFVLTRIDTEFIAAAIGGNHPDMELICMYLNLVHSRLQQLCGDGYKATLIITDPFFGKQSPFSSYSRLFQTRHPLKSNKTSRLLNNMSIAREAPFSVSSIQDFTEKALLGRGYVLKDWQKTSIEEIVNSEKSVILIKAPTGGGKSIVFQGPSLFHHFNNTTANEKRLSLVITPLRALMADQVAKYSKPPFKGKVDYINSDTPDVERRRISERIRNRETALLYIAPERLRFESTALEIQSLCRGGRKLRYIIFDEAHCISQFGVDYRPDYLWAARWASAMLKHNPGLKVILLSATVGKTSMTILKEIFGARNILVLGDNNIKPFKDIVSITIQKIESDESLNDKGINPKKIKALWDYIKGSRYYKCRDEVNGFNPAGKALFFCFSRDNTSDFEKEFKTISKRCLRTANYHAGMSDVEREQLLQRFAQQSGHKPIDALFTTSAFGMGMDIPNILFVAHLNLPFTVEDFVQEVGRAVRDVNHAKTVLGQNAQIPALVLYDDKDRERLNDPEKYATYDKWKYNLSKYWDKTKTLYESIYDNNSSTRWAIKYENWRSDTQTLLNLLSCDGGPIKGGYIIRNTIVFKLTDSDETHYGGKLRTFIMYLRSRCVDTNGYCRVKYTELLSDQQLKFENRFELQDIIRKGIRYGAFTTTSKYLNICHRLTKRTKKEKVKKQERSIVQKSLEEAFDIAFDKPIPSDSRVGYLKNQPRKIQCIKSLLSRYPDIKEICENIAKYAYDNDGCYIYELLSFTDNNTSKLMSAILLLILSLNVNLANPPADLILIENAKNKPLGREIPKKWVKYTGCLNERSKKLLELIDNYANDEDDRQLKAEIQRIIG